ncbi:phosphate starvation protein PhoH [Candidatus Nitrosoglobus terrae]|uniref:Phosphate starvation protein PhoH n=1 Tax=Candidatus Nitrosoglobus terrae TaxID=1630141 RepID=A0A1Q2SLZ3_9GAMM|nr:PhoH family protein [Candidatus Nitrosoglobus terrae]BAW80133.1 phosphate starvation protein PhoH [Candidatus Nitrosoglobus terrae]
MSNQSLTDKRIFVLDTNVLMHDPAAIFRFHEHDIYLPMIVLEELDAAKKGSSEVARNVRQATRFLNDLLTQINHHEDINQGLRLSAKNLEMENTYGRLFFQTHELDSALPTTLPSQKPDNNILRTTIALQEIHPECTVILVSKDINLRIKATVLGILAEDYYNDKVLDDVDLLYTGHSALPCDFWVTQGKTMDSWSESGRTFYRITSALVRDWYPNQCLYIEGENNFEAIVRNRENETAIIELVQNYRTSSHTVWGISARNREQNFALNLLLDPEVDFVTLLGAAGTGKTLLALAAGLTLTLETKLYREIIMTRVTIPVGEDIGFLPGTEEEKMTPWMGALMDNLEVLANPENGGEWARAATNDLLQHRIKIRSLNFMRGRTFLNRFIIIDEAQNLTSKQMKTLITRAGPGTKIVCLGNIAQIDTPYLTETTSGLTYVVDHFKTWDHSGHITLLRGERSRLADFASGI